MQLLQMRSIVIFQIIWTTLISHSTDKNENILKWTLCKDHPELLLCRWSGLNSSFPTVYHDTKIIQKTGNIEGPQSAELKENSHEKLFTQVIPQATSFKWTEELENLREWEEELNRREKETQTNIEYSSQREEITLPMRGDIKHLIYCMNSATYVFESLKTKVAFTFIIGSIPHVVSIS
uniref:MHC_I-like_Ag-recog domain-containing protein n=1 Tax=Heterorhabditis bacteriophora TaxID=37862 RepID=A0A1I7XGA2_HETBA